MKALSLLICKKDLSSTKHNRCNKMKTLRHQTKVDYQTNLALVLINMLKLYSLKKNKHVLLHTNCMITNSTTPYTA